MDDFIERLWGVVQRAEILKDELVTSTIPDIQSKKLKVLEDSARTGKAQAVARQAAALVQDKLASNLAAIVTKALQTVFDDDTEFVVEFVERRNVTECDLYVRVGGKRRDILRGDGGGLADICGICLQLAYIMLSDVDRVYIADEPARHLDSAAQLKLTAVLKTLCKEFGFTMIFVSHEDPLADAADKVFRFTKEKDKTLIEEVRK